MKYYLCVAASTTKYVVKKRKTQTKKPTTKKRKQKNKCLSCKKFSKYLLFIMNKHYEDLQSTDDFVLKCSIVINTLIHFNLNIMKK